jgi:hypothetical protein
MGCSAADEDKIKQQNLDNDKTEFLLVLYSFSQASAVNFATYTRKLNRRASRQL